MKPILTFIPVLVIILLAVGCKKDNSRPSRSIIAGVPTVSTDWHVDLAPDQKGTQELNINFKGAPDILLYTYPTPLGQSSSINFGGQTGSVTIGQPFGTFYAGSSVVSQYVAVYSKNVNVTFAERVFHKGEVIDRSADWLSAADYSIYSDKPQMDLAMSRSASEYYPAVNYNPWSGEDNYLGIRIIRDRDTSYGWVKLSIIGYSELTVYEYAANNPF